MNTGKKISVDNELYSRIKDRSSKAGFDDPDKYASFILSEVIAFCEEDHKLDPGINNEQIQDRLKSLGYLEQ